jgi:peptidyl-prolyl cis-trans isomerase C
MRTALVLVPLLAACASTGPRYLAKVNGDEITRHELRAEFKRRHGGHEKFLGESDLTRRFLDRVIDRRLLLQEGYRIGLDRRPEIVELRTAEERARAKERLFELEIDEKARPTGDEIRAIYDKHTTTLFEARQVVTATREEAEAVRAELAGGADFETVARARSIGPSARYGGRLPALGWGSMDPAWEKIVFALAPGERSPVIEIAGTFEVVELVDKKTVDKPPFPLAAERIKGVLTKRKKLERAQAFSDELWARYHARLEKVDLADEALVKAAADGSTVPAVTWDGGGKVTVAALAQSLEVAGLAELSAARRAVTVERALRQLVNEELATREALARGLDRDPAVKLAVKDVVEDAMEGLLYSEYILKDVKVTDEEVEKYHAEHKAELMTEEQRLIAHILVPTKEEAVALRKEIDAGQPFADLARKRSKDTESARKGGTLGLISRKEVPPELASVLELEEGKVSEPLQTKLGWHLFKVHSIVAPREQTLEEIGGELHRKLKKKKVDEQRGFWVARLRADARIDVSDAELRKLADEVLVEPEAKGAPAQPAGGMPPGHGQHAGMPPGHGQPGEMPPAAAAR